MPMAGKKWTPAQRRNFERTMKRKKIARLQGAINKGDSRLVDFINGTSTRVAMQQVARKKFAPKTFDSIKEAQRAFSPGTRTPSIPSDAIHFAHGHVRSWLETFANRVDVPISSLTERVGELLLAKTRKISRS